jgi:hypothetical protein
VSPKSQLALVRPPLDVDLSALAADRRAHERLTISALDWLNDVRLKYGPSVSLIDLSVGGAQIETTSHRLEPGRTVVIEIAGADGGELSVPARVLRCGVTAVAPQITYRGALEFKQPLALPERAASAAEPDTNPLHEHARLTLALRRAVRTAGGALEGRQTSAGAALLAAREIIESSGRRAGRHYAREMSRLMRAITRSVEGGGALDRLPLEIAEHLRRAVPARSIRLVDRGTAVVVPNAETMTFDIAAPSGPSMQLLAEFPPECCVEEWHVQLLKTAAHLITANHEAIRRPPPADDRAPREEARGEIRGWNRLVVRYKDGRMLKGFGRDFFPANGQIHVWPKMDAPRESRITVRLGHLKAVFFVHDFEGAPLQVEQATPTGVNTGRRIIVTFVDGEALDGTTLNYAADAPGFFVSPADVATNNQRIFVVNEAVRHVQFP